MEALYGRALVERAMTAAFGIWRNKDIDPVAWQQTIRSEWEKNAARRTRVRIRRSTKRRRA